MNFNLDQGVFYTLEDCKMGQIPLKRKKFLFCIDFFYFLIIFIISIHKVLFYFSSIIFQMIFYLINIILILGIMRL